jgi:PHD/YefM family antitoxin component YafN of YafNO toxin-antitoxin module
MNSLRIREAIMIATEHTQSLTEFRQHATETLDRLDKTGEAEILTVNGEARAVLLSPSAYDHLAREAQLSKDVAMMRRAKKEIAEGKFEDAEVLFDRLHTKLLAMKTAQAKGKRK